ncbi:uncharacterized protein [Spinacia oleracea]|uniref:Reverse transcriptase domain-containing protein n=1 Tax=Spinacia oleracea TaxID=3562 RepID=A0ABM3RPK7_SPIOL|nr:uncharacterized protein LOC110787758 [Spinacia oleracea]
MALKLDISKAYDSLEWDFIRDTLIHFDFPDKIIDLIMSCIISSMISVLWNGEICDKFKPTRGIRQGDPLSSYIFVLCLDRLSSMIEEKVQCGSWKPIALTKTIKMSHVFYADDVFLFSTASIDNMHSIMNILDSFGEMSGLKISMSKSTLIFPRSLHKSIRQDIASTYGFKFYSCFGKYLSVDIRPNKLRISNYLQLLDKSTSKVRGWQAKLLNMAGRCTLIKSVLNSHLLYVMQTNLIPASTIHDLEKCTRKFLWNKPDQNRYMSRLSWDKITSYVTCGGLGIRRLKEWNLAFIAKLGWAILTKPNKLWVKVFKEKYIKKSNFMDCISNGNHSPLWRDILKGRSVLQKGLIINIGNGKNTSLWFHHWIGETPFYTIKEVRIPDSKAHWFVNKIIQNGKWHEILPVAQKLNRFIKEISPNCSRCLSEPESHLHLFRDCTQSSILWSFIFQRIWKNEKFDFNAFYNSDWKRWIDFNLSCSMDWKVIFAVGIWHIWISRNSTVFEFKMKNCFSLYNNFFVDWKSTNFILQGKEMCQVQEVGVFKFQWIPPKQDFMKLNVDSAWKSATEAGGGGVFRRPNGSWFVGFSSKFNVNSPLAAELYALREGLMIAKDLKFDKLEVETDAIQLKLLLSNIQDQAHHELGPVLREVAQLLGQNWTVLFSHIPRFCNKVAHDLAAHSMVMAVGHKLHYIIPACAKEHYFKEFESCNQRHAAVDRNLIQAASNTTQTMNTLASSSSASEIVFGTIVSNIKQTLEVTKRKEHEAQGKGKGKVFEPFVVGGSTVSNPIEIVELEEGEVSNN